MKGDGEPRSRSFVLFHFWRCDQRGEALVELKQPLPLSSSSSLLDMAPCLASVGKASVGMGTTYESTLGALQGEAL